MNSTEYQRQWQQHHTGRLKGLDLSIDMSPRSIYPELERSLEKENYKKEWREVRRKNRNYDEPGSQRKTWNAPTDIKLSPRGTLDTGAIISHVQKEKARDEYEAQWRQFHQRQQGSPRAPPSNMTGGQKLDTDRILRNVVKDNVPNDGPRRRRADADSGLNNLNPASAASNPILGKEEYRKGWEERNQLLLNTNPAVSDPRRLDSTAANDSTTDDYRRTWEKFNAQRANNSVLKDQTDDFKAGSQPGNESDSVKWQQRKQRNDEYNAFLANKNQRGRFDEKRQGGQGQMAPQGLGQPGQGISSLPRLNYSTSAQKRQREEERNREYNEMLQQKAQGGSRARGGGGGGGPPADVRTGWGTPDYSDILAKQRAKEQNFRRANDIAYEADPVTRQVSNKPVQFPWN